MASTAILGRNFEAHVSSDRGNTAKIQEPLTGVLIGTAVGDALGLPAEGLSRKGLGRRWRGLWRDRFVLNCGKWSGAAEHTIFVAQALLTPANAAVFQSCLGWNLRLKVVFLNTVLAQGLPRLIPDPK